MRLTALCLLLLTTLLPAAWSQDTFSIVAVDSVTGEVGGAGASCIDANQIATGVAIINDLHPNRGAIHTQAYWLPGNQTNAGNRMNLGDTPQQIITWLVANDVQNNPAIRQYGIVDFDPNGSPRTAAHTGVNTDDYKNHILGPNYSIQGNILLGQQILDSMEVRFLNTQGDLACKLMAALQGANVPGGDTRCLGEGVSSLSAFVKVADTAGNYTTDIVVDETPFGEEPIDSLQTLFDAVHVCGPIAVPDKNSERRPVTIVPNPFSGNAVVEGLPEGEAPFVVTITNVAGQVVSDTLIPQGSSVLSGAGLVPGNYLYTVRGTKGLVGKGKLVIE